MNVIYGIKLLNRPFRAKWFDISTHPEFYPGLQ